MSNTSKITTTTTMNTSNSSNSPMASYQDKITSELSPRIIKRSISGEIQMEAKTFMVQHDNSKKMSLCDTATLPPMKFVSAATMVVPKNTTNDAIPEISDEELLEMALMLEKQQQQEQTIIIIDDMKQ
ncbi:unnamed protein product [Rotaria socialis]|uniref:Uncharacterized protein n=1 Tax=Rotaria socialis TaxID=392032 RepID=A0A820VZF9_9BILA|nr:unnamed protein product [Rotaria socialis]CAF4509607.1 unnamed protein product [Rotaria socialis]